VGRRTVFKVEVRRPVLAWTLQLFGYSTSPDFIHLGLNLVESDQVLEGGVLRQVFFNLLQNLELKESEGLVPWRIHN